MNILYEEVENPQKTSYSMDFGTSGLIIRSQSRTEIMTDKYLALGLRPGRIKNRDLWDIGWLYRNGISPDLRLLVSKLDDYGVKKEEFIDKLNQRITSMSENNAVYSEFKKEMVRFLPGKIVSETIESKEFWFFLVEVINENWNLLKNGAA